MQQVVFFAINVIVFAAVCAVDRKYLKDYLFLCLFTLAIAFVFETACTFLGFWSYNSLPKIPLISLYVWLLYAPYISFCYFVANRIGGRHV
jgi:hypothetical protein